jgi:hypothetical protein
MGDPDGDPSIPSQAARSLLSMSFIAAIHILCNPSPSLGTAVVNGRSHGELS